MVLWIHDISDIPIDLLKVQQPASCIHSHQPVQLTNYLKLEDMGGFFLVEVRVHPGCEQTLH